MPLPDNLKHLQNDVKHTPAGLSLHDNNFKAYPHSAAMVAPDPHRYTVDLHGSTDNVRVGNTNLTPKDLADIIRGSGDWDGKQPIRLISCQTGTKSDGFAAQLSRELGVDVVSPTKDAWVDDMGNVFASSSHFDTQRGDFSPGWPPNGDWVTFKPDGTSTKHDRPTPPGSTPTWGDNTPENRPRAWRRGEPVSYIEGPNGSWIEVPARNAPPPHPNRGDVAPQWTPNQHYAPQHGNPQGPPPSAGPRPQGPVQQRFPQHPGNQHTSNQRPNHQAPHRPWPNPQGPGQQAPRPQGPGPQSGAPQHRPQFDPRQQQGGFGPRPQQGGFGPPPQQGGFGPRPQQGGFGPPPQQGGFGPRPQQGFDPRHRGADPRTAPQAQPRPLPNHPPQQARPTHHQPSAGHLHQRQQPMPMRGNPPVQPRVHDQRPAHDPNRRPDWQNQQAPQPRHDQVPVQHTTPTRDLTPPAPPAPAPVRPEHPAHTPPSSEPPAETPKRQKSLDEMNDWEKFEHAKALYAKDHPELDADEVNSRTADLEIGPDGRFIEPKVDPTLARQDQIRQQLQSAINDDLARRRGGQPDTGRRTTLDQELTFEPGGKLPPDHTREIPPGALDGAPVHVDLTKTDYPPVYRDVQDLKRMLSQPFFRIDGGKADAIHQGEGIAPRNPENMSISHHVSGGVQAMVDGKIVSGTAYVSFSSDGGHVATRNPASIKFDEETDVKVRDGLYRRVERITEAYHPNGISTDHTDRDNGLMNSSNRENEYLFPGGMGDEYVYRTWERVTYYDDNGEITDQEIVNPRVNENFKWLSEMQEIEREMQR